jgi:hypothetical protein
VPPDDPSYQPARAAYQHGQHVDPEPTDQLVLIEFDPRRPPGPARRSYGVKR